MNSDVAYIVLSFSVLPEQLHIYNMYPSIQDILDKDKSLWNVDTCILENLIESENIDALIFIINRMPIFSSESIRYNINGAISLLEFMMKHNKRDEVKSLLRYSGRISSLRLDIVTSVIDDLSILRSIIDKSSVYATHMSIVMKHLIDTNNRKMIEYILKMHPGLCLDDYEIILDIEDEDKEYIMYYVYNNQKEMLPFIIDHMNSDLDILKCLLNKAILSNDHDTAKLLYFRGIEPYKVTLDDALSMSVDAFNLYLSLGGEVDASMQRVIMMEGESEKLSLLRHYSRVSKYGIIPLGEYTYNELIETDDPKDIDDILSDDE